MLRQIKYFITVVDSGSFTEAAEELYISQSAVSQQISALESELGVKLLRREKRKFELTEAGKYLYRHGQEVLDHAEKLKDEVRRIGHNDGSNRLTIGYLKGYSGKELQAAISAFKKQHPQIVIDIASGSHIELYNAMRADKFDMVLSDAFLEEEASQIKAVRVLEEPCYIDVAESSSFKGRSFIEPADFKDEPCSIVAAREQRENEKDFYCSWYNGFDSKIIFAGDREEARLIAASGHGFMPVVDSETAYEAADGLVRIPICKDGKPVMRSYYLIWRTLRENEYLQALAGLIKEQFAKKE